MSDPLSNAQVLVNTILDSVSRENVPRDLAIQMATVYAAIAQAEQTQRLADSYDALLQFNIENMEQSRKQSAELSMKMGALIDSLAGIEE